MLHQELRPFLPRSEVYLTLENFIGEFTRLFATLKSSFHKLECMQSYQEPGVPSFEALQRGDVDLAHRLISDHIAKEEEWFTSCLQKGVEQVRLRLVQVPLTRYLDWEFKTYQHTARWGQRIGICDITNNSQDSLLNQASDFLIFDNSTVLAHDYSKEGLLKGAWLIDDSASVSKYNNLFDMIRQKSIPLAAFERKHGL